MKKIDILFFEGCPNHTPAVELAREVAAELNLELEINEIEVTGPEDAIQLRFLGSPSIRVDGLDIEPAARHLTKFGFSCRTYSGEGLPPKETLADALLEEVSFRNYVTQYASPVRVEECCVPEDVVYEENQPSGAWASGGAFVAAIIASACCWLPLILVSVGASAGGVAVMFEKTRPLFLSLAGALLASGFYLVYFKKEKCNPGSTCETPNSKFKRTNKLILWVATSGTIIFALFPTYVGAFATAPAVPVDEVDAQAASKLYFAIDGMTCSGCSVAIHNALMKIDGVAHASVDFETATATAVFEKSFTPDTNAILQVIKDAGFQAAVLKNGNAN
jgi:copper chaperone CopZ